MRLQTNRAALWSTIIITAITIASFVFQLQSANEYSFFLILLIAGAAFNFSQIQTVKISEEGVELNAILGKSLHLKWDEIETISIDDEHLVDIVGSSSRLSYSTRTCIKFIPFSETNKKGIGLRYSKKAIAGIRQYTKMPIFDSTSESEQHLKKSFWY